MNAAELAPLLLSPWAKIFAFVWGTLWGSFAGLLIHRLPQGTSIISPRSRCSHCERQLAWYENIPVVSYLVLRGRCRTCKTQIGLRTLVIELLAGLLSFTLYLRYIQVAWLTTQNIEPAAWLLWFAFCLALLVVAYIDLDAWIIPDGIVLPFAVLGIAMAVIEPAGFEVRWREATLSAVTGYGTFAGLRWLYLRFRGVEGLGLGDAKLLLMVGAWLGLPGLLWTIGAGALQGVLVSVPTLLLGKQLATRPIHEVHGDDPSLGPTDTEGLRHRHVPFGPFLVLAALEYVFLHDMILDALRFDL